jgi:hypothetical protein
MNKATFQYTFINAYKRYCYLRKIIKKAHLKNIMGRSRSSKLHKDYESWSLAHLLILHIEL